MRQTKTRETIMTFLLKSPSSYTPYEIARVTQINPVTVYRVLNFLKSQKLVHHIPSLGQWSACQCPKKNNDDHGFLICKKCHHVEEFTSPHNCFHAHGFECEEHITEVIGVCHNCH